MSYMYKKIPDVDVVIITIRGSERGITAIPGISNSADVEILLFKDEFSLTSNISELGDCFIVDSFKSLPDSFIASSLKAAVIIDAQWEVEEVFYAVPLEMVQDGRYKMESYNTGRRESLFKCSSATLFDSDVGTVNCLKECLFQIDYLMGDCTLGIPKCSEGLHNVSTNKKIISHQS